ncbi:hypothetical protein [Paraburkholderia fungorum]|uniref:hypothetical protein n=1 Tax=Paraburkholderia fungorum TaxID=134537 RepID=UPI000E774BB9|nr:hypothetical protein [Paraburkholderia fungorum]
MIAKIIGYPTENELRERITRQIGWRGATDQVALIWHGYLTGLMEWGVIELDVFERLSALLPKIGHDELVELSLDEPACSRSEEVKEAKEGRYPDSNS